MKRILTFTIVLCIVGLLAGCSVRETVRTLDAAEEAVERQLDQAEDGMEKNIRDAAKPAQTPAAVLPENVISTEEAQEIALKQAGFTANQVSLLRVEFDYDDGIAQYDVSFREGQWEYEFEIHAETGEILSWEKDD